MTGSHEVRGSIPLGSTKSLPTKGTKSHNKPIELHDEIENGIRDSHL